MCGCELAGRTAVEYVLEEGLPQELAAIVDELGDAFKVAA